MQRTDAQEQEFIDETWAQAQFAIFAPLGLGVQDVTFVREMVKRYLPQAIELTELAGECKVSLDAVPAIFAMVAFYLARLSKRSNEDNVVATAVAQIEREIRLKPE